MSVASSDTGIFSIKELAPHHSREHFQWPHKEQNVDYVIQWLNDMHVVEDCQAVTPARHDMKSESEIDDHMKKVAPWAREFVGSSYRYRYGYVDTHFHVDNLVDGLNSNQELSNVLQSLPDNYDGFIAVFSHPSTFDAELPGSQVLRSALKDKKMRYVMGCAPKYADCFNFSRIDEFQMALYAKNVIAVGPCGLDCTIKLDMGLQKSVFKLQIEIATEMGLPLVIQSKMADLDCLDLLERHTPPSQKIHIQGFEGDETMANYWISSFPTVYFGLTPIIGDSATPGYIKDMVKSIPLNRILLESGAPNFVPEIFSNDVQNSHFGFALVTAQAVGALRGISMDTVLKVCRDNTRRFYDM